MFAWLFRTIFEELLQPDDNFIMRCRKALLTALFVFGAINVFSETAAAVTTSQWFVLDVVNTVFSYVASAIWIASWLYAKLTRTSPDWLMNLDMELTLCLLIFCSFVSPARYLSNARNGCCSY